MAEVKPPVPYLGQLLTEYVKLAKLTKSPTFHGYRHTFISWCANELAIPLPVVQKLAGHEAITTTMGYVHTSGQTVMDAMERSLALAGLSTPSEHRRAASSGAAAVAAWMAGSAAYERFIERASNDCSTSASGEASEGPRGEYMGNAPSQRVRAGRSGVVAEVA